MADPDKPGNTPSNLASESMSPERMWQVLHELRVHQIELEVQNEELRRTHAALESARARYFDLYDLAPVGYCTVGENGLLLEANLTAANLLETQRNAVVNKPISRFIDKRDQDIYYLMRRSLLAGGEPQQCELRLMRPSGESFWAHLSATAVKAKDGTTVIRLVLTDISQRRVAEEKLRLAASVFSHSREAIMITRADGTIIDVNEAFTRITGFERDEVIGRNPQLLSSGRQGKEFYEVMWQSLLEKKYWSGEVWNRRKNGEIFAELQTISAVCDADGVIQQFVSQFSDISLLKAHERELERIAHCDALTTLPNRVLLADRLRHAMTQATRRGTMLQVVFIDLDGFKAINDKHGHEAGDELLVALSSRMKHALREGDTLARLGGDEFIAVLVDLVDVGDSVPILDRLVAAAAQPVTVAGASLQVTASLGVTSYPQSVDVDADQLLRQADQAMYQAKLAGKNRYHLFDIEDDRCLRGQYASQERIRRALADNELLLYYQPTVNLRSGEIISAKALIHWRHPERGIVPLSVLLPAIEDTLLAVDLGEWMIDTALSDLARWRSEGLDIMVSVNVGVRQLQQPDFIDQLSRILARHPGVKPEWLELEILENCVLEDVAHVSHVVAICRDMGIQCALDDFGAGYSSLSYLRRLPVDLIKIDPTFVRGMLDDPDDLAILSGVMGLATAFGRRVIVEGVETPEHGTMLLQSGCELAQGDGIAHPMPANLLKAWSAAWRPDPAWHNQPTVARKLPRP